MDTLDADDGREPAKENGGGSANTPDSTPGLGLRVNLEEVTVIWQERTQI